MSRSAIASRGLVGLAGLAGLVGLLPLAGCPGDGASNPDVLWLATDGDEQHVRLIDTEPAPF